MVKSNLQYLINTHQNRLSHQLVDNGKRLSVLEIIEKLKKTNNWKNIFDLSYKDAVKYLIITFKCDQDVAEEVFKKPISYLTKGHEKEIEDLRNIIAELTTDKSDIYEMLLKKYKALKPKVLKEMTKNTTGIYQTKGELIMAPFLLTLAKLNIIGDSNMAIYTIPKYKLPELEKTSPKNKKKRR